MLTLPDCRFIRGHSKIDRVALASTMGAPVSYQQEALAHRPSSSVAHFVEVSVGRERSDSTVRLTMFEVRRILVISRVAAKLECSTTRLWVYAHASGFQMQMPA